MRKPPHPINSIFDEALSVITEPLKKVEKSDLETARLIVAQFFKDLNYIFANVETGGEVNLQTKLPPRYEIAPRK